MMQERYYIWTIGSCIKLHLMAERCMVQKALQKQRQYVENVYSITIIMDYESLKCMNTIKDHSKRISR